MLNEREDQCAQIICVDPALRGHPNLALPTHAWVQSSRPIFRSRVVTGIVPRQTGDEGYRVRKGKRQAGGASACRPRWEATGATEAAAVPPQFRLEHFPITNNRKMLFVFDLSRFRTGKQARLVVVPTPRRACFPENALDRF